ncbi:hypothetical protein [Streptomyces sp. NRRL S-244]|uniref:hypothetical protein n=1 Tax=Streptomyces sp. NRRL S-244 TaxID=1463897 RepID=UPI00131A4B6C|nr:hypothetical protein [Streptomyces sp. NRRL S-244]
MTALVVPDIPQELAEKLANLQAENAQVYADVMAAWKVDQEEARKTERAAKRVPWICRLIALGALLVMGLLAWHAIDEGAAAEGVTIITSAAASVAFVFITGRLTDQGGVDGSEVEVAREDET